MATVECEMARLKSRDTRPPDGPVLAKNLVRLGYADQVVRTTEVAKLVALNTGKPISRQRVAALLNAVRINPKTIAMIAKGLGVSPDELMKTARKRNSEEAGEG